MTLIRAKAPLRIAFAGGGTDVAPFPEREGGLVLNATINRYAWGTLRPRADDQIGVESVDFGIQTRCGSEDPLLQLKVGGGRFMMFYCPYDRKHRVAEQLTELGAEDAEFAFEPRGLRTWRADDHW